MMEDVTVMPDAEGTRMPLELDDDDDDDDDEEEEEEEEEEEGEDELSQLTLSETPVVKLRSKGGGKPRKRTVTEDSVLESLLDDSEDTL